jgi:hypothetical protein
LLEVISDVLASVLSIGVGQLALILLLGVLALGNAWSLIRSASSGPRGPPSFPASSGQPSETGHEVALAVRGVLEDYFASQREASAGKSPVEWARVARELRAEVDMLEARVARLKVALDELD